MEFGEFDFGGLALAADGEFARDEDKHATEFGAFINEIVGRFDRDELTISCERGAGFFRKVGGDPRGGQGCVSERVGHREESKG